MLNTGDSRAPALHEALAPYLDIRQLRTLAADNGAKLRHALRTNDYPPAVLHLLDALAAVLQPLPREQITGPAEVTALLMVDMGTLPQEQLRVVCLNTKNAVQAMVTAYQGSVNSTAIRMAEIFREPIRRTSAAIIVAHNHPSGDPTPSPEDVVVTRQLRATGMLLDVDVLDHLIIGQGQWVSLRERRLGFEA